jgi:hypothetical protein
MRIRSMLAAVLAAVSILAAAAPAGATRSGAPRAAAPIPSGKMGIGDSVMLDGKGQLLARGFRHVDAVVSRQFHSAPSVVTSWRRRGLLPRIVVIHLGTNGLVVGSDCDATVRAVGPSRSVYFVTLKVPRPHRDPSNAALHACVRRHANAHLIDWYGYSRSHGAWFAPDGYHLTYAGSVAYGAFIASHSG